MDHVAGYGEHARGRTQARAACALADPEGRPPAVLAIDMTARNVQDAVKAKGLPWSTAKGAPEQHRKRSCAGADDLLACRLRHLQPDLGLHPEERDCRPAQPEAVAQGSSSVSSRLPLVRRLTTEPLQPARLGSDQRRDEAGRRHFRHAVPDPAADLARHEHHDARGALSALHLSPCTVLTVSRGRPAARRRETFSSPVSLGRCGRTLYSMLTCQISSTRYSVWRRSHPRRRQDHVGPSDGRGQGDCDAERRRDGPPGRLRLLGLDVRRTRIRCCLSHMADLVVESKKDEHHDDGPACGVLAPGWPGPGAVSGAVGGEGPIGRRKTRVRPRAPQPSCPNEPLAFLPPTTRHLNPLEASSAPPLQRKARPLSLSLLLGSRLSLPFPARNPRRSPALPQPTMLRSSTKLLTRHARPTAASSSTLAFPATQSRRSNSASIGNIPPSKGSAFAMSPEAKMRLNAQSRLISGSAKKPAQAGAAAAV